MIFSMDEFKSLGKRLWRFVKNFFCFIFIFGLWFSGAAGLILLLSAGLEFFNVSHTVIVTMIRIVLTVFPLFPTMAIWNARESYVDDFDKMGDSPMDCCFMTWLFLIIIAWFVI